MPLIQYPQDRADAALARLIAALQSTAWPADGAKQPFPTAPDTHATSFVLLEGGEAVCHVGVRRCAFAHKGQTYLAYGLSEVVTHPRFQNRGIASGVIREAARFIIARQPDLSLFTCAPEKVSFYTRGGWTAAAGACLVGGTKRAPFRSDSLHLTTMLMLISEKAKRHAADFENTDIVLELGENQLW